MAEPAASSQLLSEALSFDTRQLQQQQQQQRRSCRVLHPETSVRPLIGQS